MARPTDKPSASQFKTQSYIGSWWANNPYYAGTAGYTYGYEPGNIFEKGKGSGSLSYAAARSGVVNVGGYTQLTPQQRGIKFGPYTMANPRNSASQASYDYLGNVKRQAGDVNLGLVLMGGYQFPGQALTPVMGKDGRLRPNSLGQWLINQGVGGVTYPMTRYRRSNVSQRSTGWQGVLTTSSGSNKAFGTEAKGRGQSSEDSTIERYSTEETRLGTRAQFTDESWQEEGAKFGRSWAGFKALPDSGSNPYLPAQLGQMYKRENPNVGFARRAKRTYL